MKRQKLVSCWSHQGRRGRTVWPDCYIIVQYLAMCNIEKHCPNFCRSRSKICQILKKPSTIWERLKNVVKVAKFCQIWSHWFGQTTTSKKKKQIRIQKLFRKKFKVLAFSTILILRNNCRRPTTIVPQRSVDSSAPFILLPWVRV